MVGEIVEGRLTRKRVLSDVEHTLDGGLVIFELLRELAILELALRRQGERQEA